MLHKIICVYDLKAQAYLKPVFVQSHGAAVRAFGDAVNDSSTDYHKHPEDYIMFALGEFDDVSGKFSVSKPVELTKALALLNS